MESCLHILPELDAEWCGGFIIQHDVLSQPLFYSVQKQEHERIWFCDRNEGHRTAPQPTCPFTVYNSAGSCFVFSLCWMCSLCSEGDPCVTSGLQRGSLWWRQRHNNNNAWIQTRSSNTSANLWSHKKYGHISPLCVPAMWWRMLARGVNVGAKFGTDRQPKKLSGLRRYKSWGRKVFL